MKTAVVLFNLGGPDSLSAIRPFLFNLFNDPAIIGTPAPVRFLLAHLISRRRAKTARQIYGRIGGRSPILEQTLAQAARLQEALAGFAGEWRCFIAMRYWHPRAGETAEAVRMWGPDRVLLLPLYPQYSTTTTASSLKEWYEAAADTGLVAHTQAVCCWPALGGFIDAQCRLLSAALAVAAEQGPPHVLFSAHGLPQKIVDAGDPYVGQVFDTARAIARRLGLRESAGPRDAGAGADYRVCFQSRVGPLAWVGPYTEDCIAEAAEAGRAIVVVPLASVSEHSETLVELDMDYRKLAQDNGAAAYLRVPTMRTEAEFVAGLAGLIEETLTAGATIRPAGGACRCRARDVGCPLITPRSWLARA